MVRSKAHSQWQHYTTEPVPENEIKFYMVNGLIREDTSTEPTGIIEIEDGNRGMDNGRKGWYTINGMPLTRKPTAKGIYVYNGKKVKTNEDLEEKGK